MPATKSCVIVRDVLNVYAHLFLDMAYTFPHLEDELEKDWLRLTRLSQQRGLPFFVVDLPALGKHLDRCLSSGLYKVSGLPGSRRVSGTIPIPKLFRGLYLEIFKTDGSLKESPNCEAILFLRQILYVAKKLRVECPSTAVQSEIEQFVEVDSQLPSVPQEWEDGASEMPRRKFSVEYQDRVFTKDDYRLLCLTDTVAGQVASALGILDISEAEFKHGPGAVSDLPASKNRYRFDSWPDRLESEFPICEAAFSSLASWAADAAVSVLGDSSPFAKMVAVPKTYTKPRLIASEPHYHMWCQQAIWHHLERSVSKSWLGSFIRFRDRTLNQELARAGSVDGSLSTIDLSSASDRVSCQFVSCLFGANQRLLRQLRATRTHVVSLPDGASREAVELRKYSTMGNATTFPVESLGFLAIALTACVAYYRLKPVASSFRQFIGKVTVFGDDIIVPTEVVGVLTRLLEIYDFKVNVAKTFSTGRFRESCGLDCFAGQDITPAYWYGPCEDSPESIAGCIEVSNNFYRKFMLRTAEHIQRTSEGIIRFPRVSYSSGHLGFVDRCFDSECHQFFKTRWNRDLQRSEILIPGLTSRSDVERIQDDSALLQFFTEHPDPMTNWVGGVRSRPRLTIKRGWVAFSQIGLKEPRCGNPKGNPTNTEGLGRLPAF